MSFMKVSRYNFFYPYAEATKAYVAYNSFKNSLALLEEEYYFEFKKFEKDNTYKLDDNIVQELKKGGFLIDDQVDEITLLRHRIISGRYSESTLGLTIAPTSDCNFRCLYCFEKENRHDQTMNGEVQDNIIKFVENCVPHISNLCVTWYGGEPLLALDIIEKISKRLIELTRFNNIAYTASIVTNGYLLTCQNAKRLIGCNINNCQITIDGNAETHNVQRPHVSGKNTYETIMENLLSVSDLLSNIALRVNLNKENKNSVYDLYNALKRLDIKNISVYPAPIQNTNNCYNCDLCFANKDFLKFEYEYIKATYGDSFIKKKFPVLRGNVCCADRVNTYVIDADGEMYKC